MSEITIGDKIFPCRGLTRKEVKTLKAKGFRIGNLDPATAEDALEEAFRVVFGDQYPELDRALDPLPYGETMRCWYEILGLTYGRASEEKNS